MEKFLKGHPLIFSTRGGSLEWDSWYMEGKDTQCLTEQEWTLLCTRQMGDCVSTVSTTIIVKAAATPCDIVQLSILQFNQPCRVLWQHRRLLLAQTTPVLFALPGPDDIYVCHGILLVFNAFRLRLKARPDTCRT
jgi:hypothetical protein